MEFMKTLITFVMLIAMVATGLFSYHLFRQEAYNGSFLFIIASYLSIVLTIHVLSNTRKKTTLQ
jgi:uncharacterized membrane protein HdeD (DUF308 family)